MDEQAWSIYTVEDHSAKKRKEILTPAVTGTNLEDMLSDTSKTHKAKYCVIPLIGGP